MHPRKNYVALGETACPTKEHSRNQRSWGSRKGLQAGLRPVDRIPSGPQAASLPHQHRCKLQRFLSLSNTKQQSRTKTWQMVRGR